MKMVRILLLQTNINMKDTGSYINHGLSHISAVLLREGCQVSLRTIADREYRTKSRKNVYRERSGGAGRGFW